MGNDQGGTAEAACGENVRLEAKVGEFHVVVVVVVSAVEKELNCLTEACDAG